MLKNNKADGVTPDVCIICEKSYLVPKHNPNPVIEFDKIFNIVYSNNAANDTILKFLDLNFYSHFKNLYADALKSSSSEFDFYYSFKNKHYRLHTAIVNSNSILLFAIDITKEIELTEILREKQSFLNRIIDNIPVDIALFDNQHNYLYVNKIAIKNDEIRKWIINKTDFDYYKYKQIDDQPAKKRRMVFNKAVKNKIDIEFIDKLTDKDATKYVLRRFHPVITNGKVNEVIGYAVDITDQILAHKKILKAHNLVFNNQLMLKQLLHHFVHNIKLPIANIEGLLDAYNYDNPADNENTNVVEMLQSSFKLLLQNFTGITSKLDSVISAYNSNTTEICLKKTINKHTIKIASKHNVSYKYRFKGDNILLYTDSYLFDRMINKLLMFFVRDINKNSLVINISNNKTDKFHTLNFAINNIHISQTKIKIFTKSINYTESINYKYNSNYLSDINIILNYIGGYLTIEYMANKLCLSFNIPVL